VESDTHLRKTVGESRRVGTLLLAVPDCLIGYEPRVAPAAEVTAGLLPAYHVGLVLVRDADAQPVQGNLAVLGEMEDEFVGFVQEAVAAYRLVVADRHVSHDVLGLAHVCFGNCDGLDPEDNVLENEHVSKLLCHV